MKKTFFSIIIAIFAISIVFAQAASPTIAEPEKVDGVSVTSYGYDNTQCNISQNFMDSVKTVILSELNLTGYSYSNITSSWCYNYGDYNSISFNILVKESESSIIGKTISSSFYTSTVYDYDILFNAKESEVLDYTLKEKYAQYVVNATDESYYVQIYAPYGGNSCDIMQAYFENLEGEKYFNNNDNYCSVVVKTRTSQIKSLVSEDISSIYYFGNSIQFNFIGYSEGSYNLEQLSTNMGCELSKLDYYYPEFTTSCYGMYKDTSRLYFYTSTEINGVYVSLDVYGIIGGRGVVSVSAYGDGVSGIESEINNFVSATTSEFFNTAYAVTLSTQESWTSGTLDINNLELNTDSLNGFTISQNMMNTYYSMNNTSITITEPYIQVYVPEDLSISGGVGVSSSAVSSVDIMPRPYYWSRYFVVTKDKLYSEITLNTTNSALAESKIKEFIDSYVPTSNWVLNMSVVGGYFGPYYLDGRVSEANTGSISSSSGSNIQVSGLTQNQGNLALNDPLSSQHPELTSLETQNQNKSIITMIVDWVKANIFNQ
ncbi:Uncharacterised protein [Candidatus Tiddalikarchaeum anstoanum]|nr:Uncharacterised protein [Candidatus Tiddalikarchaeum anstoanum]